VLARALAKDPAQRYASGAAFAAALTPFIERYRIVEERPPAERRFIRSLQRLDFFDDFSDVEIARLLELVSVRSFQPGDALVPGPATARTTGDGEDAERRLLVLTDGLAKVHVDGELTELVGEGSSIGELGFINGVPDTCRVHALTSVHALELSAESLSELPPKVHLHYYRVISDRLAARLTRREAFTLDFTL